jgi:hypothetical protein
LTKKQNQSPIYSNSSQFSLIFKSMKKVNPPSSNFFARYHHEKIVSYSLSAIVALTLGIVFTGALNGVDTTHLMASVANVATPVVTYDADLVLNRDAGIATLTLGTPVKSVDRIDLTLLSDPARIRGVTSIDSRITVTPGGDGTYRISIATSGEDLPPGRVLTSRYRRLSSDHTHRY